MKGLVKTIVFIMMVACFSCEEKGWFTDCTGCLSYEPEMTDLIMKLNPVTNEVKINIYEGELEDSILNASVISWTSEYKYQVRFNKKYTVTATYSAEGITYIAVDSAIPRIRYVKDQCEEPCYFVYDRIVDLRLKYTAKQ